MNDTPNNSKSLITQILEETLEDLKNHEEFDQTVIDNLKNLADSDELKKSHLVGQALKITTEQK